VFFCSGLVLAASATPNRIFRVRFCSATARAMADLIFLWLLMYLSADALGAKR